ncbi:MAG: Bax inhibitor-1/YccA family protein [Gemmatimonadetes bacterium]|nr:Bax inhibitor-1/YccA family protein [Gemmatimonadota bacterium]
MSSTTASHNPMLRRIEASAGAVASAVPMTVAGTVRKTAILLGLVVATGAAAWWSLGTGRFPVEMLMPAMIGSVVVGLGLSLLVAFRPLTASWAGPLYAVCQGTALGLISAAINTQYKGLPMLAVGLTTGTFWVMLGAYRTGLIKVTDRFKAIVVGLTGGVFVFYLISLGVQFFGGYTIPFLVESGPLGIGFSLFVTGLAAVNLLLDFRSIEDGVAAGAPAAYEWAFATAVTVTLVWLYLEILRLLRKLRR